MSQRKFKNRETLEENPNSTAYINKKRKGAVFSRYNEVDTPLTDSECKTACFGHACDRAKASSTGLNNCLLNHFCGGEKNDIEGLGRFVSIRRGVKEGRDRQEVCEI